MLHRTSSRKRLIFIKCIATIAAIAGSNILWAQNYTFTTLAGELESSGSADGTRAAARFDLPCRLVVDANGNIFVADSLSGAIRRITSSGTVTTLAGSAAIGSTDGTGTAARFNQPFDVTRDNAGNL